MKRLLSGLALLALVVALAILAGLLVRRGKVSSTSTLTSGAQVRVLAVLPAGQTYDSDAGWRGRARRILPSSMERLLTPRVSGHCSAGTNSATLYLAILAPGGGAPVAVPWQGYYAEDDTGFRYPREGGSCSFGGGIAGGALTFGFTLSAFPRRQPEFNVVFVNGQHEPIGRLRVRNPFPGPFPTWQADPLPITRTNGPVVLTLERGEIVGDPRWRSFHPHWRLQATDPTWESARAGWARVADATGNEGGVLSPREPVWRVSSLVHRQKWEDFAPAERVVWAGLPVPADGAACEGDREALCSGSRLKLWAITDAGTLYFTNGVMGSLVSRGSRAGTQGSSSDGKTRTEYWGGSQPFFLVAAQNVTWDDEVRFRLRDDAGREVKLTEDSGSHGLQGGGRMFLRSFERPTNAVTLTLEVLVSRPLSFEFFLDPAEIPTAK
jgi:hypothetical protein